MTHELKKIIRAYEEAKKNQLKAVLVTVVALDGSSYRRPGVRMLLLDNGYMIGAVSGGCVEKEVIRQTKSVFETGVPKMMVYDGRYRLGCEGILYILLEPFQPEQDFLNVFWKTIQDRSSFKICSRFSKAQGENFQWGTQFSFADKKFSLRDNFKTSQTLETFKQEMPPCFRLVIIGAEHDTVQLCSYAALTGWEVTVVVNPREEKYITDFPGATGFVQSQGDNLQLEVDHTTAIMLMTHSFVKDLQYLFALKTEKPAYFGLLGPASRREKLFDALLERHPNVDDAFLEGIHGPAGIHIGAETPQEIAISIMAEILTVVNATNPISLKEKTGTIHS